ncbi:MAG: hypothetical protein GEU96_03250, partial [Propionibacteriales bacterium]|nr:hypothetical protein [Propionibacteriales bacterium]
MADHLSSRRRAEEFARAVDGLRTTGDPVIDPLVELASSLRSVPEVEPTTQFRDNLRSGLLEAARTELHVPEQRAPVHRGTPVRSVRQRRRLVAVASALVVTGGLSGVAAASQQSLPGEVLYPVKRGFERAQVELATSERAEAGRLLAQASTRLDEVESLVASGSDDAQVRGAVSETLRDFSASAGRGGELLVNTYDSSGSSADLLQVRRFTTAAADQLTELAHQVPGDARGAWEEAADVVDALDRMAVAACPHCTPGVPPLDLDLNLMSLRQATDGLPMPDSASPDGALATRALPHLPSGD